MREIKFRAWDNVDEEMLYAGEDTDVIFVLGSAGIECTDIRGISSIGDGVNYMEHLKYMQYTGLKDKNGVEIYEGDVSSHRGRPFFKVFYEVESASFMLSTLDDKEFDEIQIYISELEIIGNIYKNPELMEQKP